MGYPFFLFIPDLSANHKQGQLIWLCRFDGSRSHDFLSGTAAHFDYSKHSNTVDVFMS